MADQTPQDELMYEWQKPEEARKPAFEIGRVLARTFSAIRENFLNFFLASFIFIGIPYFLLSLWPILTGLYSQGIMTDPEALEGFFGRFILISVVTGIVMMLSMFFLQITIIYASFKTYSGSPVGLGESLKVSLRYFLPIIGLSIIAGLGMMVGFMLLVVPGIMLLVMWMVSTPALIVEKTGVMGALSRSKELTSGYKWWVLLLFVILMVFSMLIGAVGAILMLVTGIPGQETILLEGASTPFLIASAVINTFVQMISYVITASGIAALYYELRFIKEGIVPESLAAVFD